jgi:hypothetical protein
VLRVFAAWKAERAGDFLADGGRRAAREGDRRRPAQPIARREQCPVAGPEVVPPLGDAVCLIHREERGADARGLELRGEPLQSLG